MANRDIVFGIRITGDSAAGEAALKRVSSGAADARENLKEIGSAASQAAGSLKSMAAAAVGVVSLGKFIQLADEVSTLDSRLRLATGSAEAASSAYARLYEIALSSKTNLSELGATFAQLTTSTAGLGISQERMLGITEAISNAMAVSGGSAEGMRAALLQLQQGMASGVLRGEELNSVLEQSPRLAQAIAEGMGRTTGELRSMGEQGQLTVSKVIAALEKMAPRLKDELSQVTPTVGKAMEGLRTETMKFVGDLDKTLGSSSALASAITATGRHVDVLAFGVAALGSVMVGSVVGRGAQATASFVQMAASAMTTKTAVDALGVSMTVTASRVTAGQLAASAASSALAAMGGPVGLITAALGIGVTAWLAWGDHAAAATKKAGDGALSALDLIRKANADIFKLTGESYQQARSANIEAIRQKQAEAATINITSASGAIDSAAFSRYALLVGEINTTQHQLSILEAQANQVGVKGVYRKFIEDDANLSEAQKKAKDIKALTEEYRSAFEALDKNAPDYINQVKKLDAALAQGRKNIETKGEKKTPATTPGERVTEDWVRRIQVLQAETGATVELTDTHKAGIKIMTDYANGKLKLTAAEKARLPALVQQALLLDDANEAEKKARAESEAMAKAKAEQVAVERSNTDALLAKVAAAQFEAETYGMTEESVYRLLSARTNDRIEMLADAGASESLIAELKAQAQAYLDLADAAGAKASREAAKKAADDSKASAQKFADDIERALTDSLMRGFEAGKGFGQSFVDSIKATLKTAALKATVQLVMSPVTGAIQSAYGLGNAAGGVSGMGNLLSTGNLIAGSSGVSAYTGAAGYLQLGSMASSFGTGLTAAAGGADLAAAVAAYEAAGMGATATAISAGASAASALGGAAATVGSAISALSAAAPYLAIGLLAAQQLGVFNGPTYHHGGAYQADTAGGSTKLTNSSPGLAGFDLGWGAYNSDRSSAFDDAMKTMSFGIATQIAESVKKYGGDPSLLKVSARFASDNSDYSVGALRVTNAADQTLFDLDKHYAASAEQGMKDFTADATRALVGALKASKLNDEFTSIFAAVDPLTSSLDALNAALTQAAAVQQQTESIRSAIDTNFLTPAAQLDAAFAKLGQAVPATAAGYEELVRAQDLTTAAGRDMAAALLSAYPLWGQVQDAATQAAAAAVDAARQAADALRGNLVSAISAVAGSIADMRTRVRDADAAVLSARSAIADATAAAGQKAADAQAALVALLDQSAAATRSFGSSLTTYIAGLSSSASGSMSPDARYRSLGAQLQTTSVLAQAGDQASRDKLTQVADAFLQASKARSTTSVDYARDEARVRVMLQGVVDGLTAQVLGADGKIVSKPIADVSAGATPTQDQQIASALSAMNVAQADYQRYLQLAAATGTEIKASTDAVGDEIARLRATYDASASEQAAAAAQLQVALQALDQLGLTEEIVKLLAAGLDGGPLSNFATALGVSTDTIRGLQAALGLTDDALAGLASGLNLNVSDEIYAQLGQSLGVPADLLAGLGDSLGVSPLTMRGFATALGWDADKGAALATAMGWDQAAAAQLGTSIGFSDEATALVETAAAGVAATDSAVALTDALAAGVMTTQAADALTGAMRAGVGISQAASDWLAAFGGQTAALGKLSLVLGVSPAAQQAIDLFSSVSATANTYGSLVDGAYQDAFGRQADAAGKQYWMGQLYAGAVTQNDFMAAFLAGATGNDREKALAYGHKIGLPGFAVGTNFVLEDMPAIIHRGERIMPAADNTLLFEMLSRSTGGNGDVVEVLKSVLAELAEIKRSNASMSRILTVVTRGGDRLLTTAV